MLEQQTAKLLQVGEQDISLEEIVPLLTKYKMLPHFFREVLIEQIITKCNCTPEEILVAKEQFIKKYQLTTETTLQTWFERYGMTSRHLEDIAVRELLIEKFKYATWESKVEAHFFTHKSSLDKVIYSLLRTTEQEIATELYFRIEAGEQSFADLAREYARGPEAQTGGLIGPVELSKPHPTLAKMLSISQPGQLWSPIQIGEWFIILRLEKFIPAVLNDTMRQQMIDKLWETWLQEQVQQEIRKIVNLQGGKEISYCLPINSSPLSAIDRKSSILEAV